MTIVTIVLVPSLCIQIALSAIDASAHSSSRSKKAS
jgi:hypothetical protein